MSDKESSMEWVETTEEVIVTEGFSLKNVDSAVPTLEPTETSIQKLLNTVGQEENQEDQNEFYCEECLPLFQDQSDNFSGPSFILDFHANMGVSQRALLTLPFGLMIGRSSIPNAGVGVINQGPALSPGMHFGPYEGEMTTRQNAISSHFSWEVHKGEDQYEYIDAANDSYSNWLRFVNFAQNKDEANLLAVQYKGSILFHCCRSIPTGEELTVWPSSKMLQHFSKPWAQMMLPRLNRTESSESLSSPEWLCSNCLLTFTTEAFLLRHIETCRTQLKAEKDGPDEIDADLSNPAEPLVVLVDTVESLKCDDCGKVFKQVPHLRRHKLCVHSNKRPYCCSHCRRSFTQASGLIRHQRVHRQQAVDKSSKKNGTEAAEAEPQRDQEDVDGTGFPLLADSRQTEVMQFGCEETLTDEASFNKHKANVQENLRPYVCSVCQKCFGQFHDLRRHLSSHEKENESGKKTADVPEGDATMPVSCATCSLEFSCLDALQRHINEAHSEDSTDKDTNSTLNLASVRPQRLKARCRISAITKLIAPKSRTANQTVGQNGQKSKLVKCKWFTCRLCKQTFANAEDLKVHKCTLKLRNKDGEGANVLKSALTKSCEEKPFSCDRCGRSFSSARKLEQHQANKACMKYHCTSELFSCSFCQFSFTMKSYLIKHIKRHHPLELVSESGGPMIPLEEKCYLCPHCGTSCADAKAIRSHVCNQQLKVLYLCTECGKGFSSHYSLKQHQRIHSGEKPYSCTHCSKSFSYVGQLNVHLRTHTGEKPYLCTHCGESFRQSGDLKRHERKHTGVRPHSCTECNKSFSRLQSLKAHQLLHRGQKLFKCSQCGKSFSRNYHLRRHHQKVHC